MKLKLEIKKAKAMNLVGKGSSRRFQRQTQSSHHGNVPIKSYVAFALSEGGRQWRGFPVGRPTFCVSLTVSPGWANLTIKREEHLGKGPRVGTNCLR
jgi:hypothetical protein